MADNTPSVELVNIVIDGQPVRVPRGTNIILAAESLGIEIPHYCYHRHLSIAGNCRLCQIKIKGAPKLEIACNTQAKEGMEVYTHRTSPEVMAAQQAVLEFLLVNHPLDCTVCDAAGHCKLQDYYFQYSGQPSRFMEEKACKVKAEPLGPTVMLDGERCVECSRCIRFCQEITKTSELTMLNRGDRSQIGVAPGHELNNPLSGTVVDLCPVGALTHRYWRFNTRIWYTAQTDSLCPGCSTGCNVKVAVRDRQVVTVKGRLNSEVNKEWLCDEGRYGFHRFLPPGRLTSPLYRKSAVSWEEAEKAFSDAGNGEVLVFVGPDLLLEEYWLLKKFLTEHYPVHSVVVAYRERPLTKVEAVLISPDYAANFRGAEFAGLVYGELEAAYNNALERVKSGTARRIWLLGDHAIAPADQSEEFLAALTRAEFVLGTLNASQSRLLEVCTLALPARTILEKSGLMINRARRVQYNARVVEFPQGPEPEWHLLKRLSSRCGKPVTQAQEERALTIEMLDAVPKLAGLTIAAIKNGTTGSPGIQLEF